MPFGAELFDATVVSAGFANPIRPDFGPPSSLPVVSGDTNVSRFETAFQRMLPGYVGLGSPAGILWNTSLQGKILYLPTGRYLIENIVQPGWERNLWDSYIGGAPFTRDWNNVRGGNPFGASLVFPEEITLWLAPGAVLVPATGAIVHIGSAVVCDPVQVFDLRFGGLVVFGQRVPKLLPEWWKRPDGDEAEAIQQSIDAGLHHRSNQWERPLEPTKTANRGPSDYGVSKYDLPPIPVELRGRYRLRRSVEVRGGPTNTRLLDLLGTRGMGETSRRLDVPGDRDVRVAPEHVVVLPPRRVFRNAEGQYVDQAGNRVDVPVEVLPIPKVTVFVNPGDISTRASLTPGPNYDHTLITVVLRDIAGVVSASGSQVQIEPSTVDNTGSTEIGLTWADGTTSTIHVRVDALVREKREVSVSANLTLEGVWQGRSARGAQLAATHPFEGESVLKLVYSGGFTLRNVSLDSSEARGLTCLGALPFPGAGAQSIQGMAIQHCTFHGVDATLVQMGSPVTFVPSNDLAPGSPPAARWSNYGADMSGIAFDECEFLPKGHSTGVDARTAESLPFRFRGCTFAGDADTMIRAWGGTFQLDRCSFENTRIPSTRPAEDPGFETPDGVDVYLPFEPPRADGNTPPGPPAWPVGNLSAFTAVGCVSRSPTFLSTPSQRRDFLQITRTPVVLFDVRHIPSTSPVTTPSIEWHLRAVSVALVQPFGDLPTARLGAATPLVVLGGQFGAGLTTSYGAAPCAIVGARDLSRGHMRLNVLPRAAGVAGYLEVFVLPYDQRLP